MGSKHAVLGMVLALLTSCSNGPEELPIRREEITDVLLAVYLAESQAEILGQDLMASRIEALNSFGYDTADYNRTMEGLANDPEYGKEVYEALIDSVVFAQRSIRSEQIE